MATNTLSVAGDQVFLHLDYLAESACLIEAFAQRAQANAALGLSVAVRGDLTQIYRIIRDASEVLKTLEAAEGAASQARKAAA